MSEPTLYRIVAPLDKQKWPKGPKQVLVHAIMVPVEPDYEAAIKKAYVLNQKAERYRIEHPRAADNPYDRLLMDETVVRAVVDAALGIGGDDES